MAIPMTCDALRVGGLNVPKGIWCRKLHLFVYMLIGWVTAARPTSVNYNLSEE